MMGVDKTDSRSRQKAAKDMIARGVAGRNMMAAVGMRADSSESRRCECW